MSIGQFITDFQSAIIIPILGIYHGSFVGPRLRRVEDKCYDMTEHLTKVRTDVEWIRETLDKQFNGKAKKEKHG